MPVKVGKKEIGYVGKVFFDKKTGEVLQIELSKGALAGAILGKSVVKAEDIKSYSVKQQAIILNNEARIYEAQDGVAEKAGKASSIVVHKVKTKAPKVMDAAQKQSSKMKTMFKDFKDEVKRGMEE